LLLRSAEIKPLFSRFVLLNISPSLYHPETNRILRRLSLLLWDGERGAAIRVKKAAIGEKKAAIGAKYDAIVWQYIAR
jgi:hypothetical protein